MAITFSEELQSIAREVRSIVLDPAYRPNIAPDQLELGVLAYPEAGGKALRPALTCWACRALGGPESAALRAGVAVELYHTYTLVHDDIIDRDPVRRNKPSVHALLTKYGYDHFNLDQYEAAHYGLTMGILTGDIQQAWAIDLLASLPDLGIDAGVTLQLIRRLQGIIGPAIVEGEVLDVQLPFMPIEEVTADLIQRVILTKTASLFSFCAWAGGLLARGQEDEDVWALSAFAERAGIAFQLQDDILGLIGDEEKLGKPIGSDLREGKRTLIIAVAWDRADAQERQLLSSVLGNANASPDAITDATLLLSNLGAIESVQLMAQSYLDHALSYLDRLPHNSGTDMLREMAGMMIRRDK